MTEPRKYNKLQDKRILLIGGSSGMGFAVAEALVESDAGAVILTSSSQKRVDNAISSLKKTYPSREKHVSGFTVDIGNESTLEDNVVQMFDRATDGNKNKLDHIVFTAGEMPEMVHVQQMDFSTMRNGGTKRLFAPMIVGKYAATYMNPGSSSSITFTGGILGHRPFPLTAVGAAWVAGLTGLVRGLAVDLAPLRVNVVSPGLIKTELTEGFPADLRDNMYKSHVEKVPTGVVAGPEDIAEAFLYSMRDRNCTGEDINSNSGALLVG